jgi:hypothetical protein
MQDTGCVTAVPHDVALRLCKEIRQEGRRKWYTWSAWWCWGCATFTQGDPAKMCGAIDACPQVVERHALPRGTNE